MTELRSIYVTYDGALDPLGASQVVAYLLRLAQRGMRQTLISFEKPERWADAAARQTLYARLDDAGIAWRPLRYHKRPRLPATLWDVLRGAAAIRAASRSARPQLVHARGEVAMAMARAAHLPSDVRLIYEVRGVFADERVEVGSWAAGSMLDRAVRRLEQGNLNAAHGVLAVMASAGIEVLRARRNPLPPYRAFPNSVDLQAFTLPPPGRVAEFGLAYHGSLGGWYLTDEMVALARACARDVPGRVLFVTPQPDEARRAGATPDWAEVVSARPGEVPSWLRRARASFFLIQPSPSKRVSSPTKFAEALACGLPVIANGAAGDLDQILDAHRVGVLVDTLDDAGYQTAARRLAQLLADADTPQRCRALAEERYSLEAAAAAYYDLYSELVRA